MNKKKHLIKWVYLLIPFLASSCSSYFDVQNVELEPWESTVAIPLISSNISMEDMTANLDTAYLETQPDGLLHFVYHDTLVSYRIGDVVNIDDFSVSESGSFALPSIDGTSFSEAITVGDIVGSNVPSGAIIIPPLSLGNFNFDIPAVSEFESMRFASGKVSIKVDNDFSAPLSFRLVLIDDNNSNVVASANFNVPAKSSQTREVDLGSQSITNDFTMGLRNVATTGAGATYDASEAVTFTFELNEINIDELTFTPTTEVSYSQEMNVEMPMPHGIEAYDISYLGGLLTYEYSSSLGVDASVDVVLPTSSKGGSPLSSTITTTNGAGNGSFDITNASIDFTQGSLGYNTLPVEFTITIPAQNNSITLFKNNTIQLTAGIQNMEFDQLRAYLGNESIDLGGDSLEISVFENTLNSAELDLHIVNPTLEFIVDNEYGVPFSFSFIDTKVSKNAGGSALPIVFNQNPILFAEGSVGNPSTTSFQVSNLNDLFNFLPEVIHYNAAVQLNPQSKQTNVIQSDQSVTISTNVDVPLHGRLSLKATGDPIDADLSGDGTIENITKLTFHLEVENGFPVAASPQFYFLDEQGNTLDSLFHSGDNRTFGAGQVNNEGVVTQATSTVVDIEMDASRIASITQTRQIILHLDVVTANDGTQDIKMLNSDRLNVKLGAVVSATINP